MIDAAIVGLGRWGRTLVESIEGQSSRLRFTGASPGMTSWLASCTI
ncbi:MAG TPA: hypothetical protein VMS01_00970 [Stellaceae bacterium]|nr:hypothetical protein [Stellaceae bacterium]